MWKVCGHRQIERQLKSCPIKVLKQYEKWKDVVMVFGQQGLSLIKGFSDEALKGEWDDYRSSRLNQAVSGHL
jgi:mRNA-degrading endonuclease YafQ of YafQ-DinJ toxin-antitoxin module